MFVSQYLPLNVRALPKIHLQPSSTGRLQSGATWQLGTPAFSCHAAKKEDIFKRGKQTQED
jgi:hypothetical protein